MYKIRIEVRRRKGVRVSEGDIIIIIIIIIIEVRERIFSV
jgi:hypothetical protein